MSGTKQFPDMAGAPVDGPLYDNDPKLYEIHKNQKAAHEELQQVSTLSQSRKYESPTNSPFELQSQ